MQFFFEVRRQPVIQAVEPGKNENRGQRPQDKRGSRLSIAENHVVAAVAPAALARALDGPARPPASRLGHRELDRQRKHHGYGRHVVQRAPPVVRQNPDAQRNDHDITGRNAGLQSSQNQRAPFRGHVFGNERRDQHRGADAQRTDKADDRELHEAVRESKQPRADRKERQRPDHHPHPPDATARPAAENPADCHAQQHQAVVNAIKARDGETAARCMREHLLSVQERASGKE
ncbi:FCD domain-containing protein [Paraburkholderia sp. BL17N1]|nr:FCD domain-containing protein [Paraburkholderia sp. BL17N1]